MQETWPTVYSPYLRRLESLTICWCIYKGSTFSLVILRPWVLVRPESNSWPPAWQPDAQPTEPPVCREREDLKNPRLNKNEYLYVHFHLRLVIINSLINWLIVLIAQLVEHSLHQHWRGQDSNCFQAWIFQVFPHCCLNSIEKFPAIKAGLYISRAHALTRSVSSSALHW